ncbi:PREDICTED: uncharacterized protein LOC109478378 [Branchiostoma belcheri]|uniref:Uncharacterized protein LOC109478378 n=1 Tax=Branchiostoma belcheri TaxID=7741 RepID=A0A6P4Z1M6_BRABE|nr:PREDICTED: uncharacterized protein LOC109478378 [Branchiostoma belcheri]
MITSILDQGLGVMTDPVRLHAELWGDHFSKVISCWLPVLMSTVLVGRGFLGSSIQCFPLDLVHVPVQPQNGTFMSDDSSTSNAFSGVSSYTRQLSDFVNSYCAGKSSFPENTVFNSYQFFAMMLVVQAGVMYAPFLIWNVTKGKEIISIVRFIAHDMEVLYDRFRKQSTQDQVQAGGQGMGAQGGAQVQGQCQAGGQGMGAQGGAQVQGQVQASGQGMGAQGGVQKNAQQKLAKVYGQEELLAAEKQWKAEYTMYKWYVIKQAVSIVISVGFLLYHRIQLKSIDNIKDTFPCSVEEKFSVTCTVPTAAVHQFIWANIESVEKYNYVKNLLKVAPDLELSDAQKKQTSETT